MPYKVRQHGFSIAEILIAVGILSLALVMIAGVFPVGIHFTQVSIDKTNAAIIANEAFAKIRLYAQQLPDINDMADELSYEWQRDCRDFFEALDPSDDVYKDPNIFCYPSPSDPNYLTGDKEYCWAALLRLTERENTDLSEDPRREVQATVFIFKKTGLSSTYYAHDFNDWGDPDNYGTIDTSMNDSPRPAPVRVQVTPVSNPPENEIQFSVYNERVLINEGDKIGDDRTGRIYRVMDRYASDDDIVLLDRDLIDTGWDMVPYDHSKNNFNGYFMWVVPAAYGGGNGISVRGKNPCIGVFQKVLRF